MDQIYNMWKLYNDAVKGIEGKILVPLSGGLDSRILAGAISKHREIDLGFYCYHAKTYFNQNYIRGLLRGLRYKRFEFVNVGVYNSDSLKKAVSHLKDIGIDPKEYTYLAHIHGDVLAGLKKTRKQEREYFVGKGSTDFIALEEKFHRKIGHEFKGHVFPFLTPQIIGFMLSLGRSQRFFQRAYLKMIKTYLPEMYKVPRTFEDGGKPVSLNNYMIKRITNKLLGRKW